MKPTKFGVFDIILAVMFIVVIGLNVYIYGFRAAATEAKQSPGPTTPQTSTPQASTQQAPTPEPAQTAKPEASVRPEETPAPTPEPSTPQATMQEPSPTVERPTVDDFDWFLDGAYRRKQPDGAAGLSSFDAIRGEWKGIMLFDPDQKEYNFSFFETSIVTISGAADALNLKWVYCDIYDGNGNKGVVSRDFDEFEGKFNGDLGLGVGERGDYFEIPFFWEKDGKQYAIGRQDVGTETEIFIGLVRP